MKKFFVFFSLCAMLLAGTTSCGKANEPVIYDEVKSVVNDLGYLYVQGHNLVGMWVITGSYDEETDVYVAAPEFGDVAVIRSNQTLQPYYGNIETIWLHNGVAKGLDLENLDPGQPFDFMLFDNYSVKVDDIMYSIVVDRADRFRIRDGLGQWTVFEKVETIIPADDYTQGNIPGNTPVIP